MRKQCVRHSTDRSVRLRGKYSREGASTEQGSRAEEQKLSDTCMCAGATNSLRRSVACGPGVIHWASHCLASNSPVRNDDVPDPCVCPIQHWMLHRYLVSLRRAQPLCSTSVLAAAEIRPVSHTDRLLVDTPRVPAKHITLLHSLSHSVSSSLSHSLSFSHCPTDYHIV